jgi:hypothetical protein
MWLTLFSIVITAAFCFGLTAVLLQPKSISR